MTIIFLSAPGNVKTSFIKYYMNHLALTPQRLADKNHFREIRNSASISAFRVPDNNSQPPQNPAEKNNSRQLRKFLSNPNQRASHFVPFDVPDRPN